MLGSEEVAAPATERMITVRQSTFYNHFDYNDDDIDDHDNHDDNYDDDYEYHYDY